MISHDEIFTFRYSIGTESVQPAAPEFIFDVWLIVSGAIDIQVSIPDFNSISRQAHDSFDKIGISPARVTTDDNIKTPGIPSRGDTGGFFL